MTGIYRGFYRRERGREGKDGKCWLSRADQRRRYLLSWVVAATQSEKRRRGDARERDGVRVCTETQRKEKGRRGILGTWIDAVLSNHVLRLLLSVFHPVSPCLPFPHPLFSTTIELATCTCIVNQNDRDIFVFFFCLVSSTDSFLQGCSITKYVYANITSFYSVWTYVDSSPITFPSCL